MTPGVEARGGEVLCGHCKAGGGQGSAATKGGVQGSLFLPKQKGEVGACWSQAVTPTGLMGRRLRGGHSHSCYRGEGMDEGLEGESGARGLARVVVWVSGLWTGRGWRGVVWGSGQVEGAVNPWMVVGGGWIRGRGSVHGAQVEGGPGGGRGGRWMRVGRRGALSGWGREDAWMWVHRLGVAGKDMNELAGVSQLGKS